MREERMGIKCLFSFFVVFRQTYEIERKRERRTSSSWKKKNISKKQCLECDTENKSFEEDEEGASGKRTILWRRKFGSLVSLR
jgi:hypothetical protein